MASSKQNGLMQRKVKRIHFVGIGGIGMSGIAEVLINLGYEISGSDMQSSDITKRLKKLGAKVSLGHSAQNVSKADVVVTSTAVRENNPEVVEARRKNIPVIPRAEMLAELLKMKFSIAVSGSHGKTTTTSMISTVLAQGGFDPTMVIGGKLASIGSNARLGDGDLIVAEADESDGSFLKLSPTIAIITNIDREHLDYYPGIEEIKDAFLQFANIVPFYGCTVLCSDDEHVREILPLIKRKVITYGIKYPADYTVQDIKFKGNKSVYKVSYRADELGTVELSVPGMFNIYNSLAAVAVCRELKLDLKTIRDGLRNFFGVQRRLEVKGVVSGVTVVDDYGHHPTEIKETLAAARHVWKKRLVVVFQPHRFTRTKALFDEFTKAFDDADVLILNDIYPASEEPIAGINSAALWAAIKQAGHPCVEYISGEKETLRYLLETVRPKDTVITLGAGNVYKMGEAFLKKMVAREKSK
ncbi:MAG TPA: UDP-N-acetylmuramate--L-alanine ligase [Smithellaceae bacterium]|jgi:UDP-N-acetylmuramate--alanine ligase|nr:MAG: UDP-N-acetylmuramate--L-alanine ligase [Deltaproteobacteria bacterium ADurb.BinA014]HNQ17719.1 UDP-N-acetylmuramate--L-alanine ligase [Smithellaceae bacterium]HNT90287.1 UDP-N-acetylmuramate--L-alanine ligase [Smithellaceae bacterium]HNV63929.1 UDP-N-acetylmuramate--L-alanine ligase [Smithellaceae bacterium]HOF77817.1 UDP-N-acetylmuramate--L-alanine ligase [Smithellaceae bacterium]